MNRFDRIKHKIELAYKRRYSKMNLDFELDSDELYWLHDYIVARPDESDMYVAFQFGQWRLRKLLVKKSQDIEEINIIQDLEV
jgi:hypothetical protein